MSCKFLITSGVSFNLSMVVMGFVKNNRKTFIVSGKIATALSSPEQSLQTTPPSSAEKNKVFGKSFL